MVLQGTHLWVELLYLVSCWISPETACFTCIWRYFRKEDYAWLYWWTTSLSAGRVCLFPFLAEMLVSTGRKKINVLKNHITFILLHFPHGAYLLFLSFPQPSTSAFSDISCCPLLFSLVTKLCFVLFPNLSLPVHFLPQAQYLVPSVATPLTWFSFSLPDLFLFLNPYPPHAWCLTPVGSQNIGCFRCLFQGR